MLLKLVIMQKVGLWLSAACSVKLPLLCAYLVLFDQHQSALHISPTIVSFLNVLKPWKPYFVGKCIFLFAFYRLIYLFLGDNNVQSATVDDTMEVDGDNPTDVVMDDCQPNVSVAGVDVTAANSEMDVTSGESLKKKWINLAFYDSRIIF